MNSVIVWPGYKVEVERHDEVVHGTEPDPNWRHVDSSGHGHFWRSPAKREPDDLPTLEWVSLHGDDCDAEGYYRCRSCGEEVRPGTREATETIRGPVTYRLTAEEPANGVRKVTTYVFGEDRWKEVDAAVRAAVASVLADRIAGVEVRSS